MSILNELSVASELAQAVYSNFLQVGAIDSDWLRDTATGRTNMSAAQAKYIANRYTVEAVFSDTGTGTNTGAYAVLLKDKATQKLNLAVRGTDNILNDSWNANLYLLTGIPPSLNPQFQALRPAIAQWIQDGKVPTGTAIAGHSLGGYLGAALKAAFPTTFGSTYTLNAPGFAAPMGAAVTVLQAIFGMPVPQAGVIDVQATAGLSLIAGIGNHLGTPLSVEIEAGATLSVENHSIARLSRSLQVLKTLAALDPNLTLDAGNRLLAASSNAAANTHEQLVDAMSQVLGGLLAPALAIDDEQFQARLLSLTAKNAQGQYANVPLAKLAGKLLLAPVGANLGTQARARVDFQTLAPSVVDRPAQRYRVANECPFVCAA